MNGGSVAARPAGSQRTYQSFERAGVFACAGVLAALNAQAGTLFAEVRLVGLATTIFMLAGISVIIWFAMYAALKVGFEEISQPLTTLDFPFLGAIILLSTAPVSLAARAALLLAAVYLLLTSNSEQPERRVAFLLCALTGPLIWGPALLALLPQPLLSLDAHLVGYLIGSPAHGNVVTSATGGDEIFIGGPCSSVHNMSLALLLWTTAAVLFRVRMKASYLSLGFAMVAFMFILNICRVAAIGVFPQHYQSIHGGVGGELFGLTGLVGSALLAAIGVVRASSRS